jgi:glycosyltransferase involved in cell wall biosynthesis
MATDLPCRVAIVSDLKGNNDEGMKKIARQIADHFLNNVDQFQSFLISPSMVINHSADIYHFVGGPTYRTFLLASIVKLLRRRAKTIVTFSNPIWGYLSSAAAYLFPPDLSIVSTDLWRNRVQHRNLKFKKLIFAGVDTKKFTPLDAAGKNAQRSRFGLPENAFVVLHVGHLKPGRNLKALLVLQSDPEVQVFIVGSTTTTQDPELLAQLVQAGCIIYNEYLPDIESAYQAADMYVFPTRSESNAIQVPLSVLEALATDLQVISTRFGALPEMFKDKKSITFFDSEAELISLCSKGDAAKGARRLAAVEYSWHKLMAELKIIYTNLSE